MVVPVAVSSFRLRRRQRRVAGGRSRGRRAHLRPLRLVLVSMVCFRVRHSPVGRAVRRAFNALSARLQEALVSEVALVGCRDLRPPQPRVDV